MDDLDLRMRSALADLQAELAHRPIPPTPSRTRPAWHKVSVAFVGIAAATAVMVWLTSPPIPAEPTQAGSQPPPPVTPTTTPASPPTRPTSPPRTTTTLQVSIPASGPIFGEETGVLLLFDDGYQGLIAVDPDRRLAGHNTVPGQRPGDEPFSMVRVGDHLVVGWGEPFAVNVANLKGESLGQGLIFLPGPEDDRVWLVDDPWGPEARAWQVGLDGQQLTEPATVDTPQLGIPGGLVLRTEQGLAMWDAATGDRRELPDSEGGWVLYVTYDELGWCFDPCRELFVTRLETLETSRFQLPRGDTSLVAGTMSVVPAPAGSSQEGQVAAIVGSSDGQALWLLHPAAGTETILELSGTASSLAWSPDGTQLFASSWSYGIGKTQLWRYEFATETLTEVVIPAGGALSMVVIDDEQRDVYFQGPDCIDKPVNRVTGCRGEF